MHEISLCQNLLRIIEEQSDKQSFRKVKRVTLGLGEFANVDKHALSFGFEIVSRNTIAAGAELNIEEIKASAFCPNCKTLVAVEERISYCRCGALLNQLQTGNELRITSLEVT